MRPFTIACLLLCSIGVLAQDYQGRIYDAYVQGRMDLWKEAMDQMERQVERAYNYSLMYDLTEIQYGYIAYCLSMKRKKEAEDVLSRAEKQIELLLEQKGDNPRVYSLMGAFYGFRVQMQPLRAPYYGKKSEEANKKALELGPEEPQAWMEKGNIAYYKPAIFGGSKTDAVPIYEKAVKLYEASPERTRQNWIYLNLLAGLGIAYEETGQSGKAGVLYKKLLQMEPGFKWVRDELYPQYLEKQSLD
jgi:tetratricopeptide (TPR) repeat protein